VIGLASPASAAPGASSSFGLKCVGLISCGPFAASAFPGGPSSNSLAFANVAGLVTTKAINTTANSTGATASVNKLDVTLSGISTLTATTVSSQCTIEPAPEGGTGGVSGSSSIVGGTIVIIGGTPITLATAPAPNTAVTVLDPAVASVVLNRQTTASDGTLTVDAIFITLLNGQTVTVASSSCTPSGVPIPMASGTGLALGGGLLGILILGYVTRRRFSVTP